MKRIVAILCSICLIVGTAAIYGAVDEDGDKSKSPWSENLTVPVTSEQNTTPDQSQPGTEPDTPGTSIPDITFPNNQDMTEPTTKSSSGQETTIPNMTSSTSAQGAGSVKIGKTKVRKATKKIEAKKVKISLKKITGAKEYQIQISKNKKFKKVLVKKTVKRAKFVIKSKKLKNRKALYVRARAVKVTDGEKNYGKWSKKKKIRIKK
ncbi:MAG: hypothetical protein ACLRZ9_02055 [Eubacterium sp.]